MAIAKKLPITKSKELVFRVEAFNVFNHTQFNGLGSVDGVIGSSTFGNVIAAAAPRIMQGTLKSVSAAIRNQAKSFPAHGLLVAD